MNRVFLLVLFPVALLASWTADSASKFGVVFHFDSDEIVDTFADGQPCVVGPVTITSITPSFDGLKNGCEINPIATGDQGFGDSCGCLGSYTYDKFNAALNPSFPVTLGDDSIRSVVKSVANGTQCKPCVSEMVVLTVLTSTPTGGASKYFRPPYGGKAKPLYHIDSVDTSKLPAFAVVGSPPSYAAISDTFSHVRFELKNDGRVNRALRPSNAMEDYQPDNSAMKTIRSLMASMSARLHICRLSAFASAYRLPGSGRTLLKWSVELVW